MIQALNLPKAELKLTRKAEQVYVWCIIRKKQLVLTPEEWVRQHIIHFLIEEKKIPQGLIATEMQISVNELTRRCDVVVFDRVGKPQMIVECKAPEIEINEEVFFQIAQYNRKLQVQYLFMTNGLDHIVAEVNKTTGDVRYLDELPQFNRLVVD